MVKHECAICIIMVLIGFHPSIFIGHRAEASVRYSIQVQVEYYVYFILMVGERRLYRSNTVPVYTP